MGIIGCGVFDKKYIYFILCFSLITMLVILNLGIVYGGNEIKINYEYYNNILLVLLINNFGQIFFFIPELILKKYLFTKKEEKITSRNTFSFLKKEKKNLAIQYIFNELSEQMSTKDIIFIFIGSILLLIVDYIKVFIQVKNKEEKYQIILNEQYNFMILLSIVFFSFLFYKIRFYKHQIYSVTIVIILGIIRYILKINHYSEDYEMKSLLFDLFLQLIVAIIESIIIIYIKGLMQFKYLSPFKICYIFGLINSIITILLLFIFSFIKSKEKNWFFTLKYKEHYYFDNIISIIEVYGYKLFILFIVSILFGTLKLLVNVTIHKFTVCHIFLLLQNREVTTNINNEIKTKKEVIFCILILINYFIELFIILVFLEIIELKFCGLDQNTKKNIEARAELETRASIAEVENKNENLVERNDSVASMSDDGNK